VVVVAIEPATVISATAAVVAVQVEAVAVVVVVVGAGAAALVISPVTTCTIARVAVTVLVV
jgi:hypothetical protein